MGERFSWRRWLVLLRKEFLQVLGNRQVLYVLLVPPVVQLTILTYALNPLIAHLSLAVSVESPSPAARRLVDAFTAERVFVVRPVAGGTRGVYRAVQTGSVDAGLIVPADYAERIARGKPGDVQLVLDGVNAYVADLGAGYAAQIVASANANVAAPILVPQTVFAYNPGLRTAWFFLPGLLGAILMLTGILASASEGVREKDEGTLEQLVMTPASPLEVLLAKVAPLYVLFVIATAASLGLAHVLFGLPFRGSPLLYFTITSIYIVAAISIGMLIAAFAATKQQVVLVSIFTALPLILLSGALAPLESMPPLWRTLTLANPLRHYITIVRAIALKGVGLEILWPNVLALVVFAVLAIAVTASRYRAQLR